MNLSKIEGLVITGFMSLIVLLFGAWFLKYYMATITVFSAIGICFIGILIVILQNIHFKRSVPKTDTKDQAITSDKIITEAPSQETNNPNLFRELNETALKAHIALKVNECPFGDIIQKISLYKGVVFPCQLIVEAPDFHKGFSNLQNFWEQDPHDLFEEYFIKIYRNKPTVVFPYQKGSFWSEWGCVVVDTGTPVHNTLVLKDYKWILYKK